MLPRLIFANLRRHRTKSLIGVMGVAYGVAAMLCVLAVVLGAIRLFENILAEDAHYVVFERNVSDLFFSSVDTSVADVARAHPAVETANPMLFGIISAEGHPIVTCFGLAASDPRLRNATWIAGSAADFGAKPGSVVVGERASGFLKVKRGDSLPLGNRRYEVAAVFSTKNGFEDGGVFMPLATAQAHFRREGLCSVVAVRLRDKEAGADFKAALEKDRPNLVALPNEEFNRGYSQFKILRVTAWTVGACSFVLGGLSVANTLLMSVYGRVREIAVLRVCGFSGRQVAALILGESFVLAAAGIVIGLAGGLAILAAAERLPQLQGYVSPVVPPAVIAAIVGTALVTNFLGALYPMRLALRIQPAEALRYE